MQVPHLLENRNGSGHSTIPSIPSRILSPNSQLVSPRKTEITSPILVQSRITPHLTRSSTILTASKKVLVYPMDPFKGSVVRDFRKRKKTQAMRLGRMVKSA